VLGSVEDLPAIVNPIGLLEPGILCRIATMKIFRTTMVDYYLMIFDHLIQAA
jgi:hypothetical protein